MTIKRAASVVFGTLSFGIWQDNSMAAIFMLSMLILLFDVVDEVVYTLEL